MKRASAYPRKNPSGFRRRTAGFPPSDDGRSLTVASRQSSPRHLPTKNGGRQRPHRAVAPPAEGDDWSVVTNSLRSDSRDVNPMVSQSIRGVGTVPARDTGGAVAVSQWGGDHSNTLCVRNMPKY
ncbi:hypothetical protein NPIL_187151 [Nephila pilipes]|uniref:Uncharacterized protein n=1 Tax=Nephila pilipes TaxID=299642 RepID=A0A8X6PAX6_NEPPI|nr:hypothetical protein NPIL_187151 [Nephila pilipes]